MKSVIRDWFKDTTNTHWELARSLWFSGFVALVGFEAWDTIALQNEFDSVSFGAAVGAVLTAGGAGVALKDRAHPKNRSPKVEVGPVDEVNVSVDH